MGQRLRHYGALMKKNWIIWKRTLGASLCELFCPVVLMAILAIARVIVDKTDVAAQSNLRGAQLYYPVDYLHAVNSTTAKASLASNLQPFVNFSSIMPNTTDPVFSFFPAGCKQADIDDARTIIAYSGNSNLTEAVIRDI